MRDKVKADEIAPEVIALAYLERLTPEQWDRLNILRARYQAGRLSSEAWRCATAAALAGKPGRMPEGGE